MSSNRAEGVFFLILPRHSDEISYVSESEIPICKRDTKAADSFGIKQEMKIGEETRVPADKINVFENNDTSVAARPLANT